jgi:prepilin-type N-terminal cleavage/methylation domain-containing protein
MMRLKNNEQGLSLVEVLATLTILSIVGVLIWQVFFQGYNYSNDAVTKNTLTQEANIIVTNLTRIHQSNEEYTIKSSNGIIEFLDSDNNQITKYSSSKFTYSALLNDLEMNSQLVHPSDKTQNLKIEIRVTDKNNTSNKVSVKTLLYRLKDGEI